jgi:hypothetical protein
MAKVKYSSVQITDLYYMVNVSTSQAGELQKTHEGTAGVILEGASALWSTVPGSDFLSRGTASCMLAG